MLGTLGCSHLENQSAGSTRVAFVTANLVARVSGYRFELAHWGDQHQQTVAATDAAASDSSPRKVAGCYRAREASAR